MQIKTRVLIGLNDVLITIHFEVQQKQVMHLNPSNAGTKLLEYLKISQKKPLEISLK